MRVLLLNNKYLQRGGEEVVFEAEVELLRANGCHVDILQEDNTKVAALGKLHTAGRSIWSTHAYRQVRHRLQQNRYDVVHVHNFFPLFSPSVYYAAAAERVPVVQTLHQYRLMCPVGTFFRDGRVCEDCFGKAVPWPAVKHACYRDNAGASAAVAAMIATHRLARTWQRMVTRFIALSQFGRDKFIAGGLPAERIVVKPNFLATSPEAGPGGGGYVVFVGRLCEEKGIDTLMKAWRDIGSRMPLKVVGDGPLAQPAADAAAGMEGVEMLGWQPRESVYDLIANAEFIVVPSEWYEGQPVVIIEALAMGTPLVASRIGPMPEFIEEGESGVLFEPGDPTDLAAKVDGILANPERLGPMRAEARRVFESKYTAKSNFKMLMEIYRSAIAETADPRSVKNVCATSG